MDDQHNGSNQDDGKLEETVHILDSQGHDYPHARAEPQTKSQKVKRWFKSVKPDRHIELFLTLAIAVFAGVAALIYGIQLEAYKTATNETAATQIATSLPMIEMSGPSGDWDQKDGKAVLFFRQDWSNTGQTPAKHIVIDWGWGSHPPQSERDYQRHYTAHQCDSWVKGAKAFDVVYPTLNEMREFSKLDARFLYGKVSYQDVFPEDAEAGHASKKHLVMYCLRLTRFDVSEPHANIYGTPFEEGNCTDEGCGKQYEHTNKENCPVKLP